MEFRKMIEGFFVGADGKPSSKRVTAFWFVVLITAIVGTLLVIVYRAIFLDVIIDVSVYNVISLLGTIVLASLISAVLLIYGVQGWQQLGALKTMNPPPASQDTNVTVQTKDANISTAPAAKEESK